MMKNLLSILLGSAFVLGVSFTQAATYSQELQDAYDWAYSKGIVTESSIDDANLYDSVSNAQMAKILSVYAMEVLGMTPNHQAACIFTDIDAIQGDLHDYIIESCQLDIMGQGTTKFRPNDEVVRADFATYLSRLLWGNMYEGGTPYYSGHLNALIEAGLISFSDANPEEVPMIKGYTLLALMRASEINNKTITITLKPGLNTFSTPAIIKSVSFDNLGENLWFAKMKNGAWTGLEIGTKAFFELIQPLEGYLIKNMGTEDVLMTIEYDTDNSNSLMLSKNLDAGWNFLGITTINNPFDNIANAVATMKKDLTDGGISNLIQLGKTFINATKFVLGKAYAVFVSSSGTYGGINNYGYDCISMEQANITHTIEDGFITIKWDEGDFTDISLYDDERGYVPVGTVNMDDKEYRYKIMSRGEHRFLLRNGCNDFYYTVDVDVFQAYSSELIDAYNWAENNGIISNSTINAQYLYDELSNIDFVDIMNRYAENVLNIAPDTSKTCSFDDISLLSNGQKNIIKKSCQLGLLPWDRTSTSFEPYNYVTRAAFGTALSRALWGDQYEGGDPYYSGHLNALKAAGIMNNINNPENEEIKGYVLLMLMRASTSDLTLTNNITRTIQFPINEVTERVVFNGNYTVEEDFDVRSFDLEELNKKGFISGDKMSFSVYVDGEEARRLGFSMGCNTTDYDITSCDGYYYPISSSSNASMLTMNRGDTINIQIKAKLDGGYPSDGIYEYKMRRRDTNGNSIAMNLAPIQVVAELDCDDEFVQLVCQDPTQNAYGECPMQCKPDVRIHMTSQKNSYDFTTYTVGIDKADDSYNIYNIGLYTSNNCYGESLNPQRPISEGGTLYNNGDEITVANQNGEQIIRSIGYLLHDGNDYSIKCISKDDYPAYFDIDGEPLKVFAIGIDGSQAL